MDNFKQAPTVLPKNKIHIINLSLHLGSGIRQNFSAVLQLLDLY